MIDVKPINSYILVQKIKEHNQIKDNLLSLMNKMPDREIATDFESIKKTDYYLPKEHVRGYGDLFLKTIKPYNDNIKNFYNAREFWIINYWYQQYQDTDYHKWHVHPTTLLSNVYYVELENRNSTVFYDNVTKQEYKFELEEGDLVTFPSMLAHKSQSNSKSRKTIISYNADFNNINIR